MSTIRFGQACDGAPEGAQCPARYPDYNQGSDIGTCEDCGADLCPPCAERTGHTSRECDGKIYLSCA